MAKARDTGSIFQWNDGSGEGLIWVLSTDTYVSCSRSDVKFRNIKVGDTVSFVKTQDYYTNQFKATDVQRSYSHNIVKQNNPPSSQATPRGILYFQKAYYTQSQMTHIASKFKNHLERAPRVIFSDNYRDYQRKPNQKRWDAGPQAKVVATYDRSFGFPIPTRFKNSNAHGFILNDHNFKTLIRQLFTKLNAHLRSGGDVIIPAPLDSEVKSYKFKSLYFKKGKRVIYHNIGTAMLKMDKLLLIQQRIDELKLEASDWKVIKGEVNYHNYKLYTAVKQAPQEQVPHAQPRPAPAVGNRRMNNSTGCLVLQTSWYDKTQFERIDTEYKPNYASAPRFLFGDNNQDKERESWKSRQMFGGQAGVVGKYDRTIGYGIVTTFFGASTPSLSRYKSKMDEQFKPMADHLRKGYDVIVPTPTSTDINKNRRRYYDSRTKKQVIFHNLGTGIALLSMGHIKYIQTKIDELKKIARKVDYAAYYNYDPKTKQLLKSSRARPQYPAANRATEPPREMYNAPPKQQPQATSVALIGILKAQLQDAISENAQTKADHESMKAHESSSKMDTLRAERDKAEKEMQRKQSKVFDLMEKNNQLMEEKSKLMEQNILVQQQVAMLQTQLQSKEDQNTANAIQIDKLRTERDNALRTMRKIREKNEIPILSATVKRLQKETQEKDNKIQQLVKQHNDHVRSSKNKLNEVEHECKELQIQNKQLQQENEELRANQMVMDESQYLSWNNNDVGRWILSLNKKYKKYEQTLMNELEEEGICGQTLCYVKIMDITNWGIKNIVSRQDVFENIQRILRHNPQQKVRNAVEGIPTAYI
eukprot:383718_1